MPSPLIRYAQESAEAFLHHSAPEMWDRSVRAATLAERAVGILGRPRGEIIVAAAWLHCIGHSPEVRSSGFVPLDGSMQLLADGWPTPVVNLVAHQAQARLLAPAFGESERIALFERIQGWPSDILDFAIVVALSAADQPDPDACVRLAGRDLPASLSISARDRSERDRRLRRAVDRVNAALIGARALSPQAG